MATMKKAPPVISPGRTRGFSRLINEKTTVAEASELDTVLQQFCPSLPPKAEETEFETNKSYAVKFLNEAMGRRRYNEFHLLFEEPYVATNNLDLIFRPQLFEMYLTLKRPPSLKALNVTGGYPNIQVHSPPKHDDENMDAFEFIRCSKPRQRRLLAPSKIVSCVFQLIQAAVVEMKRRYKDMLDVEELSLDAAQNAINCSFRCKGTYLFYHMAEASNPKDKKKKKNDAKKKKKGSESDDSDGSDDSSSSPSEPENNASPIPAMKDDDVENEDEDALVDTRRRFTMTDAPEGQQRPSVAFDSKMPQRFIRMRIFPGFCMNNKEKVYFLGRPYPWGDAHGAGEESVVWRIYYTHKEYTLLGYIFKADNHARLRAWRILSDLCLIEDELKVLGPEHIKQAIFKCLEDQVDELAKPRWQRESVASCLRDIFYMLRDSLQHKSLNHYFIDGINVIETFESEERNRAMVRCSVLGKSENVLISTLRRAIASRDKETARLELARRQREKELAEQKEREEKERLAKKQAAARRYSTFYSTVLGTKWKRSSLAPFS